MLEQGLGQALGSHRRCQSRKWWFRISEKIQIEASRLDQRRESLELAGQPVGRLLGTQAGSHELRGQQRPVYSRSLPPSSAPHWRNQASTLWPSPVQRWLFPAPVLVGLRPTHSDTPSVGCQVTAALCCVSPCSAARCRARFPSSPASACVFLLFSS